MKMLNLLGFGERSGNGIPDIFSVWEAAGLSEPLIEEHFGEDGPDKTIVILPLVAKDPALSEKGPEKGPKKGPGTKADEIEKRIKQVYELIRKKPSITRTEIGRELHISEKQAKLAIEVLKKQGAIHREGSARNGIWKMDQGQ